MRKQRAPVPFQFFLIPGYSWDEEGGPRVSASDPCPCFSAHRAQQQRTSGSLRKKPPRSAGYTLGRSAIGTYMPIIGIGQPLRTCFVIGAKSRFPSSVWQPDLCSLRHVRLGNAMGQQKDHATLDRWTADQLNTGNAGIDDSAVRCAKLDRIFCTQSKIAVGARNGGDNNATTTRNSEGILDFREK